jgi:hypothetical protein
MLEAGWHVCRSALEHIFTQRPNWQARNDDLGPVDVATAKRGLNAPGPILARSKLFDGQPARRLLRAGSASGPVNGLDPNNRTGSAGTRAEAFASPWAQTAGGTLTTPLRPFRLRRPAIGRRDDNPQPRRRHDVPVIG